MLELHFSVIWLGQRAFVSSVEMLSTIEERRRRLLDVEDSTAASGTHITHREVHMDQFASRNTRGEYYRELCTDTYVTRITQRDVRNEQMTVTHNE